MFKTVLVANRGEIAARIIQTLKRMGMASVGIASDADRFTVPMRATDKLVRLGSGTLKDTYLNIDRIIAACKETGAEAVHPGYGLLSENAEFAERLRAAGIAFIGPTPEQIRGFGLKHTSREIAKKCDVPLLPGSELLESLDHARFEAAKIDYPVMLKSTAGGGGIGMQLCNDPDELAERYESVIRLASGNFGDGRLYLERFVPLARHVEVQIFGDGKGNVIALGTRDCSLQRRNQKVVEEAPAPQLPDYVREALPAFAIDLGKAVNYQSAGTVEFVYDVSRGEPYFLEVNTRLQVEHPVTEEIYGVDLVEWMIRQAAGEFILPKPGELKPKGHAIEVRLYAENPAQNFRPSAGKITSLKFPRDARIETWVEPGTDVSPLYDPLIAKIIVKADTRDQALHKLDRALDEAELWGIETNLSYLGHIVRTYEMTSGNPLTSTLSGFTIRPRAIEVLSPGAQSTLQDFPGRLGFWDIGVPPSGPMDDRSHKLVNRILGNPQNAAVLECTLIGPTLRFQSDALIALGGAEMTATLDGARVPYWQPITVKAGQTLTLGRIDDAGMRTYLGVYGGFDAPLYYGSRSTFTLGGFGGHGVGALKAGDTLHIGEEHSGPPMDHAPDDVPKLTREWDIGVIYGPHGAPEFFTAEDIAAFFSSEYEVHFNSARTGVRLMGPAPKWARADGGEAGLHPSNIHDNAYAIGAIDFTGDMPIILGPDGPSLGGFVCPAAVALGDLWKVGQLKPGDKVRFHNVSLAEAADLRRGNAINYSARKPESDKLRVLEDRRPRVVYRRAGDDNILIEYGPITLDLNLRLRVHLLMQAIRASHLPGIIDLTPGIRSLQVHYGTEAVTESYLLDALVALEKSLPDPRRVSVPSRIVHLPLSWNDPQAQLAMRKYQELVRPNAPWCPSNIEFIRRINGLENEDDVRRIVFDANYLVLGLGDVYLG
ncbi:MAG: urea carboxylase, partial [Alphaproteobacteria bacterium]